MTRSDTLKAEALEELAKLVRSVAHHRDVDDPFEVTLPIDAMIQAAGVNPGESSRSDALSRLDKLLQSSESPIARLPWQNGTTYQFCRV